MADHEAAADAAAANAAEPMALVLDAGGVGGLAMNAARSACDVVSGKGKVSERDGANGDSVEEVGGGDGDDDDLLAASALRCSLVLGTGRGLGDPSFRRMRGAEEERAEEIVADVL